MKRLLLGTFLLFALLGCEKKYAYVEVDKNVTAADEKTEALLSRFKDYWEYRSKNESEDSYAYELPYLNFIKDRQWYVRFHTGDRKAYKVTVLKIKYDPRESAHVEILTNIDLTHTSYSFWDQWYYVNGTWYHKYIQSILPPEPGED